MRLLPSLGRPWGGQLCVDGRPSLTAPAALRGARGPTRPLRSLCLDDGTTYSTKDAAGLTFSLNIGAYSSAYCAPQQYTPLVSFGVGVQTFDAPPGGGAMCTASNGSAVPCTGNCEVLTGPGGPVPTLVDPDAPTSGVLLAWPPVEASAADPFACPTDPKTGLPRSRSMTLRVDCDAAEPSLAFAGVQELEPCAYLITASSAAGCGTRIPRD